MRDHGLPSGAGGSITTAARRLRALEGPLERLAAAPAGERDEDRGQ
jgi:hypothetical protein